MLLQLILLQLLFDPHEAFRRRRQLLLNECVLLLDAQEFLLQLKVLVLHLHYFSLLLLVSLEHLLGVPECGHGN